MAHVNETFFLMVAIFCNIFSFSLNLNGPFFKARSQSIIAKAKATTKTMDSTQFQGPFTQNNNENKSENFL